jgi:hypothetical protein
VTTLHGRQDLPDIKPIFLGFDDMPLVSISSDQRRPVASANFAATIHHGLPLNLIAIGCLARWRVPVSSGSVLTLSL